MKLVNWNPDLASAEVEREIMDGLERVGEKVASAAKQKVPVGVDRKPYGTGKEWTARRAGALRDSIRVVRLKGDPKMNIRVYAGSEKVYYGRFVEYGTVKMKARPFLRPSLNQFKPLIAEIIGNK